MKVLGTIFRIIAGLLLGVYLLILILLNFSPATLWLTKTIETALEEKLATELNIGKVEIALFDRVILHDVQLYDQQGKEMLKADLVSVKVNLPSVIRKKLEFRTISLLDSDIKLYKENKIAKPNFQFLVDAFKVKDKKEPTKLDLTINSLIVRRTNVSYDQLDQPQTPGLINFSHIKAKDLDASISLKHLTQDSLNMRVRNLSVREQSGLDLRKLQLAVSLGKKNIRVDNLNLILPNSSVKLNEFVANYKGKSLKDKIRSARWNGALRNVVISTDDIACFYLPLKDLHQTIHLDVDCKVSPQTLYFSDINLRNKDKSIVLQSDVKLDLFNHKLVNAYSKVDNVQLNKQGVNFIRTIVEKNEPKSKMLNLPLWKTLETLSANGKIGFEKNKNNFAQVHLVTNLGEADADLIWKGMSFKGDVSTKSLNLAKALSNEKLPSDLTASVSGLFDLKVKSNPNIDAKVEIEQVDFNDYIYRGLSAKALMKNHLCEVELVSTDDAINVEGQVRGYLKDEKLSDIVSSLNIHHFDPNELKLTKLSEKTVFSANVDLSLSSLDLNQASGKIDITDFNMNGAKSCYISTLSAQSQPTQRGRFFSLNSEFADLDFDGPITKQSLEKLKETVLSYIIPEKEEKTSLTANEEWVFRAKVKDTDILNTVFDIPLSFASDASLEGRVGGVNNEAFLSFFSDGVTYGKMEINKPRLYLRGQDGLYKALVQCGKQIKNTNVKFELNAETFKDKLVTEVLWDDASLHKYYGSLGLVSQKSADGSFVTEFQPTELMINDSLWVIVPGKVTLKGKDIDISDIGIARQGQSLNINGNLSKDPEDVLVADLERIDINYILELFNVKPVKISGNASGKLTLSNAFDSLKVEAKGLDVPNFAFNDAPIGHGTVDGAFSMKDKRIRLKGNILEDGVGFTNVEGYISPAEKSLDLRIKNKNTNLAFLNRYISTIFGDLQGRATGNCRVYGNFTTIDFEGIEDGDASASILVTGVPYQLKEGKVRMTPGCFEFSDFKVSDGLGGVGVLNGQLNHKHLKDLTYDINVSANDLLFYDRPQELDMPFYATAGGTGVVNIKGKPGELSVDAHVRPHNKTQLYYLVDSPTGFDDVEFLKFRDAEKVKNNQGEISEETEETDDEILARDRSMDIILDFTIDMNPEAKVFVVTDEKSGDRIQLGGTGTIAAKYYNKGDFQMTGNFIVQSGNYKLSLQDVIRKEFVIEPGGVINFTGNPLESTLNIRAKYLVPSVSLSDLNIGTKLSDSSVPVNCVLLVGGTAGHPQISFDLDMPRVSDDIKRMVRSLINTEEDMNMQVLYLLGVGRFYTYNYASTAAAEMQTQSTVAMKSFLSNTLTGQLNNIISNAMGSSNWTFGTNLNTGSMGWSDIEVEGLLSGRLLNNRLLINGNFGYRERPQYGAANFVGDFDVQYLLTPSGGVSVKVYSETNDRYFSKSSLTTQGAGIQLKRQFSNIKDLFTIRKKKRIKVYKDKETEGDKNDSIINKEQE